MPSTSEKQRRFIWAKRREYGKKKSTPKKWKWIWKPEWVQLKESKIKTFEQFNESYGTLSNTDLETLEDLCLDFIETWNLKSTIYTSPIENNVGYLSLQMFDRFHIQFSVQLNENFNWEIDGESFQGDLRNLLSRIHKFGFHIMEIVWNSEFSKYRTFSFQISHTDEKSKEIFNSNLKTN